MATNSRRSEIIDKSIEEEETRISDLSPEILIAVEGRNNPSMATNSRRSEIIDKSIEEEETRISDLSPEILMEIISSLSINTIKSCIRVCKQWYNLLTNNPVFSQLHFSKSPECFLLQDIHHRFCHLVDPEEVFRACKDDRNYVVIKYEPVCGDLDMIFKYDFGLPVSIHLKLVSSSNGFICLISNLLRGRPPIYVLNPIIGEYVNVRQPPPPPPREELNYLFVTRFGYISRSNEYKLVQFQFKRPNVPTSSPLVNKIAVHTLGTNNWRMFDCCANLSSYNRPHFEAVVNGSLHWVIPDNGRGLLSAPDLIASFNYDDEQLKLVPPPLVRRSLNIQRDSTILGVINGCLSICVVVDTGRMEIFVMKEYGVQKSWITLLHFWPYNVGYQPFKILNDGRRIIFNDGGSLRHCCPSINLHNGIKFMHGVISNIPRFKIHGMIEFQSDLYTPSFVSFRHIAMGENLNILRIKSLL